MRRLLIFGTALILLALFGPRSLAAPDPAALSFCRNLQNGREDLPRVNRWTFTRDLLKLALAPGHLVGLRPVPSETPGNIHYQDPAPGDPDRRRHLIFSFTPPESLYRGVDLEALRADFHRESTELRALSGPALFLLYTPDPEACALEVERTGFDHGRFLSLLEGQTRFRILEQISEASLAERAIKRALRRSRVRWEMIPVADLNEVLGHLSNPDVEDVILIGHGNSDGKLLDARNNAYPRSFFERFSPRLRSLALFSCHSEDVGSFYGLERNLHQAPSFRAERALYLSPGSRLGGGDERVPIRAFPRFLRRLERDLFQLEVREARAPTPGNPAFPAPLCKLILPGLKMLEGTFGFILNGHFIGSVHEDEADPSFEWPCSLLREGRNIIEMRSMGTLTRAKAHDLNFAVTWEGPITAHDLRLEHFMRSDGSHQGSKIGFLTGPN